MDEKSFLRYLILRLFIRFQQNIQKFTFLRLNIFKRNEQLLIVAYLVNVFDNWDTSLQVYGIFQTQFDAESFIPESWNCLQVKYKMELTFVVTEIGSKNALIHLFPLMFSQNNGVQKMFEWKLQKKNILQTAQNMRHQCETVQKVATGVYRNDNDNDTNNSK